MEDSNYDPVSLNAPSGPAAGEEDRTDVGVASRVSQMGLCHVFPFLSAGIYVFDIATDIAFIVMLFQHAREWGVVHAGLNLNAWAGILIILRIAGGILANLCATLERIDAEKLDHLTKLALFLLCLLPDHQLLTAMWWHLGMAVGQTRSVSVMEWAGFTRLLHGMVVTVPQAIFQTYYLVTVRFYLPSVPAVLPSISITVSVLSAALGFTFHVIYKYYDSQRDYPDPLKSTLLALASFFIIGGRSLTVALVAFAYWPWFSLMCLLLIWLSLLVVWTVKVHLAGGNPRESPGVRCLMAAVEILVSAASWKWYLTLTLSFIFLSVAYFIQGYTQAFQAVLFGVAMCAHLLGFLLLLASRGVHEKAFYETLQIKRAAGDE
ncbi:uncharacterized protein LOC125029211 [Penaeus chinensis]|uniref:uncharacterized protein LOC125029211 n=1 Tax=Penaeus chinensis TaxID=139456 RepID=UPI001FB80C96|nr:uncharacterized protein LOC125029211 [Penaeus chinensis]